MAFKMLKDNVGLNFGLKNKISLFNICIGFVSGIIKLGSKTQFGDSMSSIEFSDSTGSITVGIAEKVDF